jgi:hypothetical protein
MQPAASAPYGDRAVVRLQSILLQHPGEPKKRSPRSTDNHEIAPPN